MDRFRRLLFYYLLPHKFSDSINKEFMASIKENFFDSLEGWPVQLKQLSSLEWQDLKRLTIKIWSDYPVEKSRYVLILNLENMKVVSLFVQ